MSNVLMELTAVLHGSIGANQSLNDAAMTDEEGAQTDYNKTAGTKASNEVNKPDEPKTKKASGLSWVAYLVGALFVIGAIVAGVCSGGAAYGFLFLFVALGVTALVTFIQSYATGKSWVDQLESDFCSFSKQLNPDGTVKKGLNKALDALIKESYKDALKYYQEQDNKCVKQMQIDSNQIEKFMKLYIPTLTDNQTAMTNLLVNFVKWFGQCEIVRG
jgi:hypothetical protein